MALALYDLHQDGAWFVVVSNGLAGVWALSAHWFPLARRKALWWFIGLAELSILAEVGMGVGLVNAYDYPNPKFHAFYGFVAIIAAAIIYSYRTQIPGKTYLLYGGGSLFLMGLVIRAMVLRG